jgi:hypothetical protein
MGSRLNKSEDEHKKIYNYYYCQHCKRYFTMNSYLPGSVCPFCSIPGGAYYSLAIVFLDEPVRDRYFIAIPQCVTCARAIFCPDCMGADKRQADHCRTCSCAKCCSDTTELANDIRSGRASIYRAIREVAEKKGLEPRQGVTTPKPMAENLKGLPILGEVLEEIPF